MNQRSWLYRRVVWPMLTLLKQGITPEKLALSVAVGAAIGCFPVLGVTTLLCAVVALVFRLNIPAIQLANYLVYPLQFLLMLPFVRLGELLTRTSPMPFSVTQMATMMQQDLWGSMAHLGGSILRAIMAWSLVAPVAVAVLVLPLTWIFRRVGLRTAAVE